MIKKSFFNINGRKLNYKYAGKQGEIALLFLHGFPDNADIWDFQLSYFKDDFFCLAPSIYGTDGGKTYEDRFYSIESYAKDLSSLIQSFKVQSLIIVAHDMGGPFAGELCNILNEDVKGCIYINSLTIDQFLSRKFNLRQLLKSYYMFIFQSKLTAIVGRKVHNRIIPMIYDKAQIPKDDPVRLGGSEVLSGLAMYRENFKYAKKNIFKKNVKIKIPSFFIQSADDPFLETPEREELLNFFEYPSQIKMKGGHWVHRVSAYKINTIISEKLKFWTKG